MSEAPTPSDGALDVGQAVAALRAAREPENTPSEAPEAPVEAAEEPEQVEAEASPAEEAEGEPETPPEEAETEAEAAPVEAIDPPRYWSKDAKEAFAKLPPDLQAVVLAQEGPREEAAAKAKAEAADVKKAAEAEIAKVQALANQLGEFLPQAVETFQARWGDDPDWDAYAEQHGTDAAFRAKTRYETELAQLQKVAKAKQEAEAQAHQAYVKAEAAKLVEIAPDLADPEKGQERRTATAQYLVKSGVDPDSIRHISASEMSVAYKAMLWDEAQAKLKAAPKNPTPAPQPQQRAPVRPTAAANVRTTQQRSLEQHEARLNKSGDVMDAVRLLQARRKA